MAARTLSDSDAPAPGRTRRNRGSEVVRTALINAAIAEFAAHGFEGASTRAIAEAADAHQSQIKYHFAGKEELWRRGLMLLIEELDATILDSVNPAEPGPGPVFEAMIRGLVKFASVRPELNRIMMHEATSPSERLAWLVDTQIGPRHAALTATWVELVSAGIVEPIDAELVYHSIIGAASLLYANAPEAVLLGIDPADPDLVESHADAIVSMFLRRPT